FQTTRIKANTKGRQRPMLKTLTIEGMTCMHCAGAVTKALNAIPGAGGAAVDLDNKKATVEVGGAVSADILRTAVEEAGYEVINID
ncbi:MAG: heavy-metal-associated domain-containing protein, partial [Oscillospiraceae bacterium]|nr:heavy-metal-associated domain-containing protein [Oscillospiraceae bacterium]